MVGGSRVWAGALSTPDWHVEQWQRWEDTEQLGSNRRTGPFLLVESEEDIAQQPVMGMGHPEGSWWLGEGVGPGKDLLWVTWPYDNLRTERPIYSREAQNGGIWVRDHGLVLKLGLECSVAHSLRLERS